MYLVAAFDPDDLPRAYGVSDTLDAATAMCKRQLVAYRQAKFQLDDPLAAAVYTLKSSRIDGFNDGVWTYVCRETL